jgi:hypothetical protein
VLCIDSLKIAPPIFVVKNHFTSCKTKQNQEAVENPISQPLVLSMNQEIYWILGSRNVIALVFLLLTQDMESPCLPAQIISSELLAST